MNRFFQFIPLSIFLVCHLPTFGIGATTLEKVTAHPALDYFAAPSQDGRYLAFVSERSGNPDIWLKSLATGIISLPRQLTTHPAVDRDPALNANGTELLYVSHKTDPRGDVYLLDIVTGKETQLTDLQSGDSTPQWGSDGQSIFYLKKDLQSGNQSVYRRMLGTQEEQEVVRGTTAFSVGQQDWIVYTKDGTLRILNARDPETDSALTSETFLDSWPAHVLESPPPSDETQAFSFTRYEEDTNQDGVLDPDDESSIWFTRWNNSSLQTVALYQLTPSGHFHLYPASAGDYVYFSDLKKGDMFRINIKDFFQDYTSFETAQELGTLYLDSGQRDRGLLVSSNISNNLAPQLTFTERAEFDLSYAENLMEAGKYSMAQVVLSPYVTSSGKIGALSQIQAMVLDIHQRAPMVGFAELKQLVKNGVAKIMAIGEEHRADEVVYGQALIDSGRLYLLVGDSLSALDYLVQVDQLENKEIRAKALFTRGTVYRTIGDEASLLQVFIDVIQIFGEDSSWGRRAVTQAIAVSESGDDVHQQVASLHVLINQHSDLPLLVASTRLRIANLYDENGEELKAIEALDQILADPPPFPHLVEQSYRRKAEILSATEHYQEAADTYAALVKLTGEDQAALAQTQRLVVLQLVRKALKDRSIGEVRIAAKAFKQIIDEHPESVEAHRGYIETKVMLKELAEVQGLYHQLVKDHPENPVYLYGKGLALSYSEPTDFPAVIALMEQAIQKDPGISYFHQTLGWAYEQEERIHGKKGFLEKAEGEYRIALELNDEFQFPQVESNLLLNLGNIYMALNNFQEAYRHYQQRETRFAPAGDTVTELVYRKNYGEACFKAGRSEESLTQYHIALKRVPSDQKPLQAVESFSQAMEINSELGNHKNMALLQRNIGVNLYNLSLSKGGVEREALKRALKSYFASLENIKQFGVKEQKKGTGLFNLDIALEGTGSQAATGFDREGEEKLMFSYIAGTYEKLSEPKPAREYYLKKLGLISASPSSETDVARLTEKAIVLNRIGKLSYELGSHDEALDYMRQSLRYTRTLDLKYGIGVNLYNISRLIAERILANETIDWPIVDTLVTVLDEHVSSGQSDPPTFFALTNTAFILANLPQSKVEIPQTPDDMVKHSIALYLYQTHAWSYYTKAQELLETEQVFSNGRVTPTLVALKLNMLELAQEAGNQDASKKLQDDLLGLVQDQSSPNGWLWYLAQAEKAEDPVKQKDILEKAFDTLMALPPQVQIRGSSQTSSSIDRLSILYVDLLVKKGLHDQAFAVVEQLNMRKVTAVLYEALGEDYFLKGLGDYEEELRGLFADIRTTLAEGNRGGIDELSPQLEEILYALYEEYPWAASSFWHYSPNADVLSVAVTPEHPYLKVVTGRNGYHGFIHDGETLQYGEVVWKNGKLELPETFNQLLSNSASLYLSLPKDLAGGVDVLPLSGQSLTLVTTFYDFVNGYHLRNLFYANVAVTSDFALQPNLTAGEIPISLHRLDGTTDHDREILQVANVLITSGEQDEFAFEVNKELQVRELLLVKDLAGGSRHTSVMFNLQHLSEGDITHLVWGLLRAGFPHIIVHRGTEDLKTIEQFVSLYLAYLADLPPNEAVSMASADIFGEDGTRQHAFVLYGYAGMDEEEKYELASSIYSEELDQAVALYKEQRYTEALHRMENALSVISYADKTEDFGELTKLTVDASFRIGDYRKAVFHQEKLLNSLGEDASVEEKSETLYRLGILYSRLEQFDTAIQHLESAIALWSQAEELDRLAEGIATLGVVRENMGAYSDALADFSRSFELYQEIGEIGDVATQYRRIGRIYYLRLNRYEKAREKLLAALGSYRELEDRYGEAETLYEIGLTYEKMGLFDEADQHYKKGKLIAGELQDPFLIASGDLYLANTAWFRGNYQQAFENLTRADKLAAESQDTQLSIMVKNTRGLIYWTLNDTDKGLVYLKQAVALAEKADIKTELASSLNNLGLIYRQRGDYVTSLEYFEKAKAIDVELNSRWGLGYDYRNIGMSLLKLNRLTEAESNFVKAEQTSAEIKNATNWVKALSGMAGRIGPGCSPTE
jgi:tetratricopeptide (TPR) repeat protein